MSERLVWNLTIISLAMISLSLILQLIEWAAGEELVLWHVGCQLFLLGSLLHAHKTNRKKSATSHEG